MNAVAVDFFSVFKRADSVKRLRIALGAPLVLVAVILLYVASFIAGTEQSPADS